LKLVCVTIDWREARWSAGPPQTAARFGKHTVTAARRAIDKFRALEPALRMDLFFDALPVIRVSTASQERALPVEEIRQAFAAGDSDLASGRRPKDWRLEMVAGGEF